jgi:glucosamine kinase
LGDDTGKVISRARSGPSNPVKVGLAIARSNLLAAAREALRKARLKRRALEAVCAGVAGVDRGPPHRALLASLRKTIPARQYLLTTDGLIALHGGLGGGPGVLVIAGTGSIAYALDARGRVLRCGGWGSLFDDEGSGYDIGRKALAGALRSFDGRSHPTRLMHDLTSTLKLRQITETVGADLQANQIAALFPVVARAAKEGDRFARRLLQDAGEDLAQLAWTLVKGLGGKKSRVSIILAGGVFKESTAVQRSFERGLRRRAPGLSIELLDREPVECALILARSLAERPSDVHGE